MVLVTVCKTKYRKCHTYMVKAHTWMKCVRVECALLGLAGRQCHQCIAQAVRDFDCRKLGNAGMLDIGQYMSNNIESFILL